MHIGGILTVQDQAQDRKRRDVNFLTVPAVMVWQCQLWWLDSGGNRGIGKLLSLDRPEQVFGDGEFGDEDFGDEAFEERVWR